MGINPRSTNSHAVLNELQRGYRTIENGIIKILQYAGEQFVKDARDGMNISGAFPKGDYTDRTVNLRSSTGYFILKDGVIINSDFQGTAEGITAARTLLAEIPNKSGYQLVGVAGMDYASYVESKGYNVITSQADIAIVNIERMLQKFKDRLNKKGANIDFDMDNLVLTSTR